MCVCDDLWLSGRSHLPSVADSAAGAAQKLAIKEDQRIERGRDCVADKEAARGRRPSCEGEKEEVSGSTGKTRRGQTGDTMNSLEDLLDPKNLMFALSL